MCRRFTPWLGSKDRGRGARHAEGVVPREDTTPCATDYLELVLVCTVHSQLFQMGPVWLPMYLTPETLFDTP